MEKETKNSQEAKGEDYSEWMNRLQNSSGEMSGELQADFDNWITKLEKTSGELNAKEQADFDQWMAQIEHKSGNLTKEEQVDFGEWMDKVEKNTGISETARFHMMLLSKYQTLSHDKEYMAMLLWGMKSIRWIGLLFIAMSLVDIGLLLVDLQFKNPASELTVTGSLVSHTTVAILGVVLFFLGGEHERTEIERKSAGALSWVMLVAGIIYLLLIPLMIMDYYRIDGFQSEQHMKTMKSRLASAQTQQDKLINFLDSPEKLQALQKKLAGTSSKIESKQQFDKAKSDILARLDLRKQRMLKRINTQHQAQQGKLFKSTFKTVIGLLLFGIAFIAIWRTSAWSRVKQPA